MAARGQVEGSCFEIYKVFVFALQYFGYDVSQIIHKYTINRILQSVFIAYPFNSASFNANKRYRSAV